MIHNESAEAYHARKAVSAGFLWQMVSECPAQAWYDSVFNPEPPEPKQARELDIGTAAHLAVLENHAFADRCTLIAADSYRTKEARELRDQAYIDGKTPLLPDDYALVVKLRSALLDSAAADLLFGAGQSEVSYTWPAVALQWGARSKATKMDGKARADRITPHAIVDLKTASSASPEAFQRAMVRDGHHLRAAWYLDGYGELWRESLRKAEPPLDLPKNIRVQEAHMEYLFVVVAKAPPHLVEVYPLEEGAIHKGRALYRKGLELFRQGVETDVWPGYRHRGERIGLPTWYEYHLADMVAEGALEL